MYDDDAKAEVRRLRLMATPDKRHRSDAPIARGSMAPALSSTLLIGLLVAGLAAASLGSDRPATVTLRSAGPHAATPPPTVAPPTPDATTTKPATAGEDLVAAAERIKPLEDIEKGDRVIYQKYICTWQKWGGDITVSTITCGDETFQIQTGRLTPVELKSAPSSLRIRH